MVHKASNIKIWRISYYCINFFYSNLRILAKVKIDYKNYLNKTLVLITITLIVFITRNISRLNKEAKLYNYNPTKNSYFQYIGGDKNFYFRYNDKLRSNSIKYSKISLLGDKISITKLKKIIYVSDLLLVTLFN